MIASSLPPTTSSMPDEAAQAYGGRVRVRVGALLFDDLASPTAILLAEHAGDALYAVAAYCAIGVAAPHSSARRVAILAFAFSTAIECSQLVRAAWLVELRQSLPGRLVLGQGFQFADLVAYAIGAAIAWAAESWLTQRSS